MASTSYESDDFEIIYKGEACLGLEDLAKIQNWLLPTDYTTESSEFRRHIASQAPGTGHWICETPKFQQWQNSAEHGSLWIEGVPGAGKSVIAASMVKYLRGTDQIPVLFFFFRHVIAANRKSRSLLQDWLAQLLLHSFRLQAIIEPLSSNDIENISDEQLWEHLLTGLSSVEKIYCVVDGLDEMEMELDRSNAFLQRLNSLATFRPEYVKLLMTSRPKEYLRSYLRDASIIHISLERDLVGKDIATFVSHRLCNALPSVDVATSRDLLSLTISKNSRGLFLYARLLLDQIIPKLSSISQSDAERLASILPIGLEDMYNGILFQQSQLFQFLEHPNLGTEIQVFLLGCVTHSSRPLRLNELADALSTIFLPFVLCLNPASLPQWSWKQVTRDACTPLLEILKDGTIRVIHHSFTEFLLDSERMKSVQNFQPQFPALNSNAVHKCLALLCLKYLQSGCLRSRELEPKFVQMCDAECEHGDWPCPRPPTQADSYSYQEARLKYPFLQYAVSNWAWHASYYDVEDHDFLSSVSNFLDSESPDFQRWLILEWNLNFPITETQIPSALHVAAFAGLTKYASCLIMQYSKVNSLDNQERTPLHWAAKRGHMECVSLLLQNGATPDPPDRKGIKPLHLAAKNNHSGSLRLLLEAGVDPCTPKTQENHRRSLMGGEVMTKGETAVEYVCMLGHTESIVAMLPFVKFETLEEILCSCCRFGKTEAVRAVLETSRVSPDAKFEGATALYLAVIAKSIKCVEMLLAKGADPNLTSEWEPRPFHRRGRVQKEQPSTALHNLALSWRSSNPAYQLIFHSLVASGANIEARNGQGETPLLLLFGTRYGSAHSCYLPALKKFLEAGADILAIGKSTTFQGFDSSQGVLQRLLSGNKDSEVLSLLFDYGADIHFQDKDGDNALHMALRPSSSLSQGSIDDTVKFLLEKGVQSNVKNNAGQTPIEIALGCSSCSLPTCRILLKSCADSESLWRCLLHIEYRPEEERKLIIQELLSAGVSLESCNSRGTTPLLSLTHSSDHFQTLLDFGANINAEDNQGKGVLHHYVQRMDYSAERLQDLVQLGLDPKKLDNDGNTLLHIAAVHYNGKVSDVKNIQKLLDFGISPNFKNKSGSTAIHKYLETRGHWLPRVTRHSIPLVELLQRSGDFDINAQDNKGLTSLHPSLVTEIEVARILEQGGDPGIVNKERRTALHLACRARKGNIVGLLVSQLGKELINLEDSSRRTALHDACTSGVSESVYCLIRAGASVNCEDFNGRSPLHACAEFPIEQSLWLVQKNRKSVHGLGPPDQYRPTSESNSKPWYASKYNCQSRPIKSYTLGIGDTVKALLAAGADINALDRLGLSPLDLSLLYQYTEMTTALQSAHQNIKSVSQLVKISPSLAIELALNRKPSIMSQDFNDSAVEEILANPAKYLSRLNLSDVDRIITYHTRNTTVTSFSEVDLLRVAAEQGYTEIVRRIGARASFYDTHAPCRPPEEDDEESRDLVPILQSACMTDFPNLRMLETLIEICKVDVNALCQEYPFSYENHSVIGQCTALHRLASADYFWQIEGLRYLIQHGAEIDAKNENGETPLHIASSGATYNTDNVHGFWKPACVRALLDLGADPNALNNHGLTPLHKAATSAQSMILLLQSGADVLRGRFSPIFSAIKELNFKTLKLLLEAGSDSNVVTVPFSISCNITDQALTALFCASFDHRNRNALDAAPLIRLLINNGANANAPLNDRETLIHYVFEHGEYDIVHAFLDCNDKVNFNAKDQRGRTVLLAACNWTEIAPSYGRKHWPAEKSLPVIRLLDYGPDLSVVSEDGRNVLHHLMDNPHMEEDAIIQLLQRKPEICKILMTKRDKSGFVPIHCALRTLRPKVCFLLLAMGSNLLDPDPTGATALHHIARQFLKTGGPSWKRLRMKDHDVERRESYLKLWKKILDLNGPINECDNNGFPPLFSYLCSPCIDDYQASGESCCHVDNLNQLFDLSELDLNIRNKDMESPLHIIARRTKTLFTNRGHDGKLFAFFAKRLDPLAEDISGRTALDVATAVGNLDILELFQRS